MISTEAGNSKSLKERKAIEKAEQANELREKCEQWAVERFTKEKIVSLSNANKGLWYLPAVDEDGNIEKCLILRPINRVALGYASSKLEDAGLYSFLEAAMRECFVEGDMDMIEDDVYFIPASMTFNDIMKEKKTYLVKR